MQNNNYYIHQMDITSTVGILLENTERLIKSGHSKDTSCNINTASSWGNNSILLYLEIYD